MIGGQVSASGQCNVGAHGRCVGRITSSGWIARSPLESLEVPDVDGQELRDAVNVHACRQPRVMHLHTPDCMCDEKPPPTVVHVPAVRQKLKVPFDHAGDAICLGGTQPEPISIARTGGAFQNSPRVCEVKQSRAPCATSARSAPLIVGWWGSSLLLIRNRMLVSSIHAGASVISRDPDTGSRA